MNKYFIYVILVVIIMAGGYFYYAGTQKSQEMSIGGSVAPLPPQMPAQMPESEIMPGQMAGGMPEAQMMTPMIPGNNYTVEIIDNQFRPAVLRIKKGDSVTWVNKMSVSSWPASAIHPTHDVYPEKGGCIASAFDACHGLKTGESWGFIFNQVGQWKYHDHLNAGIVKPGTIEVSE